MKHAVLGDGNQTWEHFKTDSRVMGTDLPSSSSETDHRLSIWPGGGLQVIAQIGRKE